MLRCVEWLGLPSLAGLFLEVVRLRPESVAIFNTEAEESSQKSHKSHKSHKSSGVSSVCRCQALELEEDIIRVGWALGFLGFRVFTV